MAPSGCRLIFIQGLFEGERWRNGGVISYHDMLLPPERRREHIRRAARLPRHERYTHYGSAHRGIFFRCFTRARGYIAEEEANAFIVLFAVYITVRHTTNTKILPITYYSDGDKDVTSSGCHRCGVVVSHVTFSVHFNSRIRLAWYCLQPSASSPPKKSPSLYSNATAVAAHAANRLKACHTELRCR